MPNDTSFLKKAFRRHEIQIAAIVVLMAIFFSALSPGFLSVSNLSTLLESYSVMAIMAAGLLVVLISGGIDISFAAIAAVTQYLVATIIVQMGGNWLVAFALAAIFGGLLGAANALLIYYLQALSVIVTISTMTFYFAVLMFVTDGESIYDLPDWFTTTIAPLGIPFPVMVAAIVLIITAFVLNRLSIGRQIYGLGGNLEGAKRMGCNILGLQCFVYGYSGVTAGDSGVGAGASGRGSGAQCTHRARARRAGSSGFRGGEPPRRHRHGHRNNLRYRVIGHSAKWSHPLGSFLLFLWVCDRDHHFGERERDGRGGQAPAEKDYWKCRLKSPPLRRRPLKGAPSASCSQGILR